MANEFIARKGLLISGSTRASGSVTAFSFTGSILADNGIVSSSTQFNSLTSPFSGSFTGSFRGPLTGTGSWASSASTAVSSSYALTASYALNGGTGTAGNSFVTFSVAGQSDVIADSATDTLTLVAGSGISLTTNASTDAITITATAAAPQAFNADKYSFVGDGTTVNYNVVNSYALNSLLVSVDGLTYTPTDDYSISTNTLTFVTAPPSQSNILVTALVNATTAVTGSFTGSFTGAFTGTGSWAQSASRATTSSFAISASWAPGGAGTVGPGISGSIPVFNTTTTLGSSVIYQGTGSVNSSDIGIGQPNPDYELDVNGTLRVGALNKIDSIIMGANGIAAFFEIPGSTQDYSLQLGSDVRLYVKNSTGNVGIGTTTPANKLHVVGNVSASSYTSSNALGFLGTSSWAVSSSRTTTASFAVSASWAPGGSGTVGPGVVNSIALFNTANTVSSSVMTELNNAIGINNSLPAAGIDIDALSLQDIVFGTSDVNNFAEINIQNTNAGTTASSDLVATSNIGGDVGGFIDVGINSSTYQLAGNVGGPNDGYLYMTSSNGELYIGNATPGASGSIKFFAGGLDGDLNTHMYISSSGRIGIGVTGSIGADLQIEGNVSASSYTSSRANAVGFLGTSSWAQSSSITLNVVPGTSLTASIGSGSLYNVLEMSMFATGATTPIPLASGTTASLDLNASNYFVVSASGTGVVNWRALNPPATNRAQSFVVRYINGGAVTNTWFTGSRWAGGTAPTLTTGANPDLLGFVTDNSGSNWYGVLLQRNSS